MALGCDKLAALEENIVITFMEPSTDNNNRLAIILNKAYKVFCLLSSAVLSVLLIQSILASETRKVYGSIGPFDRSICVVWPHNP